MTGDDFIKFSSFNLSISLGSLVLLFIQRAQCTQPHGHEQRHSIIPLLHERNSSARPDFLSVSALCTLCMGPANGIEKHLLGE